MWRRGADPDDPRGRITARYGTTRTDEDLAHRVLQAATAPWLVAGAPTPTAADISDALALAGAALRQAADRRAARPLGP